MAIFAELDQDKIVIRKFVIGDDVPTTDGPLGENDMHPDGEEYCRALFNIHKVVGFYKQTSPTSSFRGKHATKGDTYDEANDRFVPVKPFPSFVFDETKCIWEAPVAPPKDPIKNQYETTNESGETITVFYDTIWDEDNLRWRGFKDVGSCYWDPNTSTWIEE